MRVCGGNANITTMLLIQRLASLLKALISGFTGTLYIHIILTLYFGNSTIIVKGVYL